MNIGKQYGSVRYVELDDMTSSFGVRVKDVLDELRQNVGVGLSLEEVMDVVWDVTGEILPHDRIGLSFIDHDGERVTARFFRTSYDDETVRLGKEYGTGLAGSTLKGVLDSGSARIINNLESYLEANPQSVSSRLLVAEGVRSSLTIPLKVEKRDVGFLFFSSRIADSFKDMHARILLEVSDIISQNIEKVWRIHQLEESRKDYLNMLGFVSHEMKSPLASMMSVGSTYAKGYMGDVDPLGEKTVNRMMKISGYLINMVNNYLDLSRLESGEMKFQPVEGVRFREDVLNFALDTVSARAEERGSTFKVEAGDDDIVLKADLDLLRIVAVNLLDNAVKYGNENIEVQVTLKKEDNRLIFSVRNEGVGFTKEQSQKLFRRFSRLKQKGTEDRRGTGLGLYLTWWIIQKHEGRIIPDSEPGKWAEFTVELEI